MTEDPRFKAAAQLARLAGLALASIYKGAAPGNFLMLNNLVYRTYAAIESGKAILMADLLQEYQRRGLTSEGKASDAGVVRNPTYTVGQAASETEEREAG